MPRPTKCRRICSMPPCTQLAPTPQQHKPEIVMSIDEYETIRLIDLNGLTQEQCAEQMGISRTTAQAMYSTARRKLAECIVQGRKMRIIGGVVKLCELRGVACDCCCRGRVAED